MSNALNTTTASRELRIAETATAISDGVHSDNPGFRRLYEMAGEAWGGFPGIWMFIANCAVEYEDLGREDEDNWIEDCNKIAKAILAIDDRSVASEGFVKSVFR